MHRASELRLQTTPAEQKLWAYLRTLRGDGGRFRRQHAIGLSSQNRVLIVAHSERNDTIRIISARKATKNEEKFHQEAG